MPFEVTASQKDQTLPMILTLRGDENIVEEFTFDTDQAMGYLGIKRSRLNQISGRELRVARIRKDRYIRPVYRECDLKDYLEWTRATATHLSSSKAIEQAVENLDDRFNDVLQVFNEKLQQVSQEQQGWMKGEFERLPQKITTRVALDKEIEQPMPMHREDKILRGHSEKLDRLQGEVKDLKIRLKELSGMLTLLIPEMKELNVAQKSLRFDFDQKYSSIAATLQSFEGRITIVSQEQQASFQELKELLKEQEDRKQAKEVMPASEPLADFVMIKPRLQRMKPQLSKRRFGA
jgi:DNA repair exonuclease SbcCD ATPase subunit